MPLEMQDVTIRMARVTAIRDVSIRVPDQGVVTIIGANGAGKTTTLRAISGLASPASGEIRFGGDRIDHLPADRIVGRGIAHYSGRPPHLQGSHGRGKSPHGAFLRKEQAEVEADLAKVYHRFPRLSERRRQLAKTMSGGEQQMLAIGRALMARPKLLLMDEPSMGLAR